MKLIRIYLHSNTSSKITSKIARKSNQEILEKLKRYEVMSIERVKKLRFLYSYERASYHRKDGACRINGKNILNEAEEALKTRSRITKNKHRDKESKIQSQDEGKRGVEI